MNTSIKQIIITIIAFFNDEELLGLRAEAFVRNAVRPFVAAYVAGQYISEQVHKLARLIEPETPEFKLN